jgi:hypothetical protein
MFKSFASALLASVVFARGDGNGLGSDNAISTVLVDDADKGIKLTLHHYNADNAGVLEFHGDVTLELNNVGNFVRYGFCVKHSDEAPEMDCLNTETDLNPEKIASDEIFKTDFTITDSFQAGASPDFSAIKKDREFAIERPDTNFMIINEKSTKECETLKKGSETAFIVKCSNVNVHYYRNFETTEKEDDAQMSLEIADAAIPAYGFVQASTRPDFSKSTDVTGKIVSLKPVTAAFKAAVEAKDGGNGGNGGNGGTKGDGDDSAATMTVAFAATAALAALF